jgi:hypothetical protein
VITLARPAAQLPRAVPKFVRARVYYHVLVAQKHVAQCRRARQSTMRQLRQAVAACMRIVVTGRDGGSVEPASLLVNRLNDYRRQLHKASGSAYDAVTALIYAAMTVDYPMTERDRALVAVTVFHAHAPTYSEIDRDAETRAAAFHATGYLTLPDRVLDAFRLYWRIKAYDQAYAYARFSVENPLDASSVPVVQEKVEGWV